MIDPALHQLTLELGEIFETALAVEPPAGLTDRWRAILARYDVTADPADDDDRYELAERFGLARGAPPGEVKACVDVALARFVAAEQASGRDAAALGALADTLTIDAEERYLGYATHRAKSMFAHAVQTAHARKGTWTRPPGGYILRCPECGGPRLDETLACGFCAAQITG